MIENLIKALVPQMFAKLTVIPRADKVLFAQFIAKLCEHYISNDRAAFELLLSKTNFDPTWKGAVTSALWTDENKN